jgi:hypothetical protein
VGVHLLDPGQAKIGELNVYPGRGAYASTLWQPGDLFRDTYWVPVRAEVPAPIMGRVKVALFLDEAGQQHMPVADARGANLGDAVTLGRFKVAPATEPGEPSDGPGLATFAGSIRLTSATWGSADGWPAVAGQSLTVTLAWDVLAPPAADYHVFMHLDGTDGTVAYGDGPPSRGAYPTDLWARGERIHDQRMLPLPRDLAAGVYRLVIGLFQATGERAPASNPSGERLAADQLVLAEITVVQQSNRSYVPLFLTPANSVP